jgi:hypothetical protein
MTEPMYLLEEHKTWSLELAQNIIDACSELPPMCGVAALISVTGAVCFNEADGDKEKALERAANIAASVRLVIDKMHQERQGNGGERDEED